jgi:DNA (cytosine-5)-methyltransferase 1
MPFDSAPPPAFNPRLRPALVADLFCGAGGSSTGAQRALAAAGRRMELVAVNHWDRAIETHSLNHPTARHYCMDLETAKPAELVPELRLDLLMASPTCTFHSRARGGRPTSDQQRMDPWNVVRWCADLRVARLLIENVPEFVEWGPIDARTGRPIKSRRGEYFRAWWKALEGLGGRGEWRIVNCADYGDATTRKRFFAMLRFDGKKVAWPAATHAPADRAEMLGLKPWRSAREIIDWSNKGRSIFARKKPLAPKTLARIYAGAIKFKWPEPFLVILRQHMDGQSVDAPLPAITAGGMHIGLAEPILLNMKGRSTASSMNDPAPTLTAHAGHLASVEPFIAGCGGRAGQSAPTGVSDPIGTITAKNDRCLVEPFILSQQTSGAPRDLDQPLPTITTGGASATDHPGCARHAIVEPFIAQVAHGTEEGDRNEGRRCKSIDDPIGTVHAGGKGFAVVQPFILNRHGDNGSIRAHAVDDPMPTSDCRGAGYVVEPFVLSQASGGAPRAVDDPLPTIVGGGERGSGTALIAPYYGSGSGETCNSSEEPLPTVTSKGRFGMVVPVTNGNGGPGPRDVDQPLPTMTTAKGGEFAVVMPVTHTDASDRVRSTDEPLPTITGAHRGELAFIAAQFGEREGQAPRVHGIEDPAPTICAQGHINLVEPTISADGRHYDILFRMLEPPELAAATGFDDGEIPYVFAGTKTEQTKQIGNAVPVNTAAALAGALMRT